MSRSIVRLARRWVLRRGRSGAPTSLLPLREVRTAVVFVDGQAPDEDPAVVARIAQRLLSDRGISVQVISPQKQDLDWIGRIKRKARTPDGEDMFLSLAISPECFAGEYEACARKARFKVGRRQLPGDVFDLVVEMPGEPGPEDQAKAIPAILEFLDKIQ